LVIYVAKDQSDIQIAQHYPPGAFILRSCWNEAARTVFPLG